MLLYFPKNYFNLKFFSKRYFQLREEIVIVNVQGGSPIGKYDPEFKIDRFNLEKYIRVIFPSLEILSSVNKILVKIHNEEDEVFILSLIHMFLHQKTEKENLDYLQDVLTLLQLVDDEDVGELEKDDEDVITLISSFLEN